MDLQKIEEMYLEFQELKAEFNVVKRMLDIYYEPLDIEDRSLVTMYSNLRDYPIKEWAEELVPWCGTILGLRINHLKIIKAKTGDVEPWKPFLHFCINAEGKSRTTNDVLLKEAARNHILRLAAVWIKETEGQHKIVEKLSEDPLGKRVLKRIVERVSEKLD